MRNIFTKTLDLFKSRLDDALYENYRQSEELCNLLYEIKPVLPLPPFRKSAISPDTGRYLYDFVIQTKPQTIVECGSGNSTLILAYALKKLGGQRRVISLENSVEYGGKTMESIKRHSLEKFVDLKISPLKRYKINNEVFLWYDLSKLKIIKIDLLFVDGPPGFIQPLSRFPALPLMGQYLKPEATIILDDAKRSDEEKFSRMWVNMFQLQKFFIPTEKGLYLFKKQ